MKTFFNEVAKQKARQMIKTKKLNETFNLNVSEKFYELIININQRSVSYVAKELNSQDVVAESRFLTF